MRVVPLVLVSGCLLTGEQFPSDLSGFKKAETPNFDRRGFPRPNANALWAGLRSKGQGRLLSDGA